MYIVVEWQGFDGNKSLSRGMEAAAESLAALDLAASGVWDQVEKIVIEGYRQMFAGERDGHGRPWQPLTERYRRRKIAQGYPDRIGVRTGEMLRALTEPGASGHYARKNRLELLMGAELSEVPQFEHFQNNRGRKNRIIADLSPETARKISRVIFRQILRIERQSMIKMMAVGGRMAAEESAAANAWGL